MFHAVKLGSETRGFLGFAARGRAEPVLKRPENQTQVQMPKLQSVRAQLHRADFPRLWEYHRIENAHSRTHEESGIRLALVQEFREESQPARYKNIETPSGLITGESAS